MEAVKCKYCGAHDVVRYGQFRGVPRWWCKQCCRKFAHPESMPGMIAPIEVVSAAMEMYNRGESLRGIRRHLEQHHNYWISESTLYDWVIRFSKMAIDRAAECKPEVGDIWILYERTVNICTKEMIFWDILDVRTTVLLASHVAEAHTAQDALDLYSRAVDVAKNRPVAFLLDVPLTHRDCSQSLARTNDIDIRPFVQDMQITELVENFRSVLKSRDRLLRRLKKLDTIRLLVDGWQVNYNYFRPSKLLGGRTPGEAAGIVFELDSLERIKQRHFPTTQTAEGSEGLIFDKETATKLKELDELGLDPEPKRISNLSWTDAILLFALADKLTDK